jgi:dethiobiotin synthetase
MSRAAVAAVAAGGGAAVTVVKPVQTGVRPGDESDMDVVRRLSGVEHVHELVRYGAALAPATAARVAGVAATPVPDLVSRIESLPSGDLVLVEGAGGLLVRLDDEGNTIADLARSLTAEVLVVVAAGLGTLNVTALTTEALRSRGIVCAGLVIGSWPAHPGDAERANLADLPAYAKEALVGALPAGAASLSSAAFAEIACAGLGPSLGGRWAPDTLADLGHAADFRAR